MSKTRASSIWILLIVLLYAFSSQAGIGYTYYNEIPTGLWAVSTKRPLIVWIHGCRQTESKFVEFSQIVEKTKHLNPLIIAPEMRPQTNPLNCWNFLSDEMESRDGKFMKVIDEVQKQIESGEVDPDRVFVGGFSSGAVFAHHLALCFPDVFKGALIHSGAPFQLSSSEKGLMEALHCARNAGPKKLKTLLYVHGLLDPIMPFFLGKNAFKQSISFLDMMDDGAQNSSGVEKIDKANNQIDYIFSNDTATHLVGIKDMTHRWSGSKDGAAFSSPHTPSAINLFLKLTNQLQ